MRIVAKVLLNAIVLLAGCWCIAQFGRVCFGERPTLLTGFPIYLVGGVWGAVVTVCFWRKPRVSQAQSV